VNGRRFVVLLTILAIAAVALIVLGVPTRGEAEAAVDTAAPDGAVVPGTPSAGPKPTLATSVDSGSTGRLLTRVERVVEETE